MEILMERRIRNEPIMVSTSPPTCEFRPCRKVVNKPGGEELE
jgi:hypothetical protein